MDNILFVLLHISTFFVFLLLIYIINIIDKKQIHYAFFFSILFALIWSLGYLLEAYYRAYTGNTSMLFVNIWNAGLVFTPLAILFTGIIYANTKINFSLRLLLLFVPPVFSYIILLTNSYHHLFFINFSIANNQIKYGFYFPIHSVFSYSYIFMGLYYLIRFSIKNSGFFSRQSIIIVIGSAIPVVINLLITTRIISVPLYTTAISFSFAIILYTYAIIRYNFLSVTPIALQTIVDKISDSFLVVNENNCIIDFNKPTRLTFQSLAEIARNKGLIQTFENTCLIKDEVNLLVGIDKAKNTEKSVVFEKHIQENGFDKYFSIEVTPIISSRNYLGTIILFKDITQNVLNIKTIEEKHAIMMEQERLASLGQLIGGIAHNLKTPIMSIAGAVEALKDLVREYDESIGDACVTEGDHHEIAAEMRTWLEKIKPYCAYMSDIIDTVKGQAMNFNMNSVMSFTINELIKRIELLMKYELIRYNCTLNTKINIDCHTELHGDVNSLVQVFDNIIMNAIHAYEGRNGIIDLTIEDRGDSVLFTIRDYAKGIQEGIKNKLLKEMITTKGKDGTGLGLYMSNSTIKGRFGGKMWFDSEEGKGTAFYIQLPHKNNSLN